MITAGKIFRPESNPELKQLLESFQLTLPENTDGNLGLYDGDRLVGCGFLKGNMFQGIAVDEAYQGEGLSATLITGLIQMAAARGITYYQVITKPSMAKMFLGLGFHKVAEALPHAVFVESGTGGVRRFAENLAKEAEGLPEDRACLVMNCNPFTLGHQRLIEQAASENDFVFVLAVQEDISEFPFRDRIRLMREGTAHLSNVKVIPGGDYVISRKTFPAYFTRREDLASAQGAMDAAVFADVVAPALGIKRRYVGTEPFSPSTARYNEALLERLPAAGIEVRVLDRFADTENEMISASKVRQCLREDDWDSIRRMVPDCTYAYLSSGAAEPVIDKLKSKE